MSEEKKPERFSAMDWQIILQAVVGVVAMGGTVLEIHPARWKMFVDAAVRFGGPMVGDFVTDEVTGAVVGIPIGLLLQQKPIMAMLQLWEKCPRDPCPNCEAYAAQGANYPVPEEPDVLVMPGRGRKGGGGMLSS